MERVETLICYHQDQEVTVGKYYCPNPGDLGDVIYRVEDENYHPVELTVPDTAGLLDQFVLEEALKCLLNEAQI